MNKISAALIALLLTINASANENTENESPISLSFGLGIPYGILGAKVNYKPIDLIELQAGLGTWGPSAAIKIYPLPSQKIKGINFGIIYGTNTIIDSCTNASCDIADDGYSGLSASFGLLLPHRANAWEFNILYVINRGEYEKDMERLRNYGYGVEEDRSKIAISVGYRWRF